MSVAVIITGNRIREAVRDAERAVEAYADRKAHDIADKAAEIAPRRTGTLAGDFTVTGKGMERHVTNTAPYFSEVELGTHKMPAEPSLGPAARMQEPTFALEAGREIGKEIK